MTETPKHEPKSAPLPDSFCPHCNPCRNGERLAKAERDLAIAQIKCDELQTEVNVLRATEPAPLPDDVAKMVQRLHLLQDEGYTFSGEAADLIERLARQVPPAITHDEWYAAQNRIAELLIFVKKISEQIPEKPDYWNSCSQCEHNASEAEDLLIAAGEVKS